MTKPTTVDEYMANLPDQQRQSLQDLREKIIRSLPQCEEKIAFGKPFYYFGKQYVVSFAAAKAHNSFHTMSFDVAKSLSPPRDANWRVDGGSVKFAIDQHLPQDIVDLVVERRLNEMARDENS